MRRAEREAKSEARKHGYIFITEMIARHLAPARTA